MHTNSLTGSGSTVNEGKVSLDEKDGSLPVFDVTGNFLNKGQNSVLDASKVDKVTVSGTHANEGKANYNDMLIAEGGSSNNSGTEKGNILTVEGTHTNSGTSTWNGVTVADKGKGENAGKLDVGTVFDVIGEFVNKGKDAVLDATKTAVTTVAGLLRNEGTANYDDMTRRFGRYVEQLRLRERRHPDGCQRRSAHQQRDVDLEQCHGSNRSNFNC